MGIDLLQAEQKPDEQQLEELKRRVQQACELQIKQENKVAELTEQLKEAKQELSKTQLELVPTLMEEFGFSSLTLDTGEKVTIKDEVQASITEAKRPLAMKWLVEHDYGGIITTQVVMNFGRGEIDKAREARDMLANAFDASVESKEVVHPGTLKSFARERMESGQDLPADVFSVYPFQKSVIKRPTAKKVK